ncbi:hypothetical protein [Marivita sp. S2033]|uniref:hypothetical protein n=1 Tax=Marivita sp. S2033 TaxID=3373187 RepID=UPI0039825263
MIDKLAPLAATALVASTTVAFGSGDGQPAGLHQLAGGTFTYEIFEASVSHVDLAECPAPFDPDTAFCRLTLKDDMAHVFAFSLDGDQPLLAVKSFELSDGVLSF